MYVCVYIYIYIYVCVRGEAISEVHDALQDKQTCITHIHTCIDTYIHRCWFDTYIHRCWFWGTEKWRYIVSLEVHCVLKHKTPFITHTDTHTCMQTCMQTYMQTYIGARLGGRKSGGAWHPQGQESHTVHFESW